MFRLLWNVLTFFEMLKLKNDLLDLKLKHQNVKPFEVAQNPWGPQGPKGFQTDVIFDTARFIFIEDR